MHQVCNTISSVSYGQRNHDYFYKWKINYTKTKSVIGEISIQPASIEDYRRMIHFLDDEGASCYTYLLPAEKILIWSSLREVHRQPPLVTRSN